MTREYLTGDRLPSGRTQSAFVFREHGHEEMDEDAGCALGSREGAYCLLRIRVENASPRQPVPIDRIVGVQMLGSAGRVWNLRMAAGQSRALCKEVMVLLKPTALRSGVPCERPTDLEGISERDMPLQLRIRVRFAHSKRQVDIVKTLRWRAERQARSSLCLQAARCKHKCVSCDQYYGRCA